MAQIGSKLPIFLKSYWENFMGRFCITFVCLLCSIALQHFKKNLREQIIRQGCIILAQIGLELPCPPKGNLLEKLTKIVLVLYPIMLYNFKKILREQIIRLHNFLPKLPLAASKREFSWKIN